MTCQTPDPSPYPTERGGQPERGAPVIYGLSQLLCPCLCGHQVIGTLPAVTWPGVLSATSINAPLRNSMITGQQAFNEFVNASYNANDTALWLAITEQTLSSPNAVQAW